MGKTIFTVLSSLGLVAAVLFLFRNDFFKIKNIHVTCEESTFCDSRKDEVSEISERLKGISIFSAPLESLKQSLQDLEWVDTVQVSKKIPSTVVIVLNVKKVAFLYLPAKKAPEYILNDGSIYTKLKPEDSLDHIVLYNNQFIKNEELRKKAIAILNEIPDSGSFSKQTISDLNYKDHFGFTATMMRTGIQVKLGESPIAKKANRVALVLNYLDEHDIKARVIDSNLEKKVLVRPRKTP